MKIYIAKDGFFGSIAEGNVAESNVAFNFGKFGSIGNIGGFRFFVDDSENAFGGGKCGLEFVKDICEFVYGSREFSGILDELSNAAEGDEENGGFGNFSAYGSI